ncbi:MAG TPA: rod-binding protein [Candidatus Limnocylindria bacterium]|jgi:Rod binding domain-containing protein|nr:rod-binding protein [Candidatus Limnocylindria bacterium]
MEITSQLPRVDPTQMPLDKLAVSRTVSEEGKVAELSRQFEAVLVRQILTEAQKPTFKSKLTPENTATSIHRDMLVNTMADQISHAGGLGLAHQLQRDLGRQAKLLPAAPPNAASLSRVSSGPVPGPRPASVPAPAPVQTLSRLPRWKH